MQNKDLTPTNLTTIKENPNQMGKDTSFKSYERTVLFLFSQSKSQNENSFAVINS